LEIFSSQIKNGIKVIKWDIKDGWKYKEHTRIERLEKVYEDIEKRMKKFVLNLK